MEGRPSFINLNEETNISLMHLCFSADASMVTSQQEAPEYESLPGIFLDGVCMFFLMHVLVLSWYSGFLPVQSNQVQSMSTLNT